MKLTITIEKDVDWIEEGAETVRLVKDRLADQPDLKIEAKVTELLNAWFGNDNWSIVEDTQCKKHLKH